MAPFLKGRTTKSDPFPRACTVYLRAPEVPLRLLKTVCAPCCQPYVQRKREGAAVTMQRSQKAAGIWLASSAAENVFFRGCCATATREETTFLYNFHSS